MPGMGGGPPGRYLPPKLASGGDGYALDTHVGGHVDGVPSGQWVSNVPMFLVFGVAAPTAKTKRPPHFIGLGA